MPPRPPAPKGQRHSNSRSHNKRHSPGSASPRYQPEDDADEVDDLAVAAAYALAVAPATRARLNGGAATATPLALASEPADDNEIDLSMTAGPSPLLGRLDPSLIDYDSDESDSDDDAASSCSSSSSEAEEGEGTSRMNLPVALEDEGTCDWDDGEEDAAATVGPPRTRHEVADPVAALGDLGGAGLTPAERAALARQGPQRLHVAGRVQQYVASERLLVVQSAVTDGPVLQAGTLLVLCMESSDNEASRGDTTTIVPCGKILDVFGPVRQPLYSVYVGAVAAASDSTGPVRKEDIQPSLSTAGGDAISTGEPTERKDTTGSSAKTHGDNLPAESIATESIHATAAPSSSSLEVGATDPWSVQGAYARYISQRPALSVYYMPDHAQVIDTSKLPRTKGCDASNAYDEEVTSPAEMDYSDDEQEQRVKKKGNRRGANGSGRVSERHLVQTPGKLADRRDNHYVEPKVGTPQGFHAYPQPAALSQLPSPQQELHASTRRTQAQGLAPSAPHHSSGPNVAYYNF